VRADTGLDDPSVAVRNAAVVVAHRGVQAVGGLLFVALTRDGTRATDTALSLAFVVGELLGLRAVRLTELAAFVSLLRGRGGLTEEPRPA
jgi:hypothetical protein